MLVRLLLLAICVGQALGAPLNAAELAALLMPIAVELGLEHLVNMGRGLAAAGAIACRAIIASQSATLHHTTLHYLATRLRVEHLLRTPSELASLTGSRLF